MVYVDDVLKIEYDLQTVPSDYTKYGSSKTVGIRLAKAGAPTLPARFDNFIVEQTL
jgi:hypothetical protein